MLSLVYKGLASLLIAGSLTMPVKEPVVNYNMTYTDVTVEDTVIEEEDDDDVPSIRQFEWDSSYKFYKVCLNGNAISYLLVYENGSYEVLSQVECEYLINSRMEKTNCTYYAASPTVVSPEQFIEAMNQISYNSYEDENEAKYIYYEDVTGMSVKQNWPQITIEDMSTFTYDGETYYYFTVNGKTYKMSSYEYGQFVNGFDSIYDDSNVSARGFGYGTLYLSVQLGESVRMIEGDIETSESIIVYCKNEAGDDFVFIVNPPTYVYFADLDMGDYVIQSVTSYEYPEYPLYCDTTYFTINEGEDLNLNLYVYRPQDEIEGVGFTEDDIETINNENAEIQQQFVEEHGDVSVDTVSGNDTITDKKSGISKILSIGIATFVFIIILGVAMFFYKKGQVNE